MSTDDAPEFQKLDGATYAVSLMLNMTAMQIAAGFDWRVIPPGDLSARFWWEWRNDKYGMRARGFRVNKDKATGEWLVSRAPPPPRPARQPVCGHQAELRLVSKV